MVGAKIRKGNKATMNWGKVWGGKVPVTILGKGNKKKIRQLSGGNTKFNVLVRLDKSIKHKRDRFSKWRKGTQFAVQSKSLSPLRKTK